jgi:hypothetical protein
VLLVFFGFALLAAAGVASYFRLSSETTALRRSVMASVPGHWDKKIAVNIGYFTMGLVRCGTHFIKMPPEPRAAMNALSGAEVGVYKLQEEPQAADARAIFASADKAMQRRGWERIVGVAKERELVAVYMPRKGLSLEHMRCCVMVWHGRELVVASARGNLAPLMDLVASKRNNTSDLLSGQFTLSPTLSLPALE